MIDNKFARGPGRKFTWSCKWSALSVFKSSFLAGRLVRRIILRSLIQPCSAIRQWFLIFSWGFCSLLILDAWRFRFSWSDFVRQEKWDTSRGAWWLFISTLRFGDSTRCFFVCRLSLFSSYVKRRRIELRNEKCVMKNNKFSYIRNEIMIRSTNSWAL